MHITVIQHEEDIHLGYLAHVIDSSELTTLKMWEDAGAVARFHTRLLSLSKQELTDERIVVLGGRAHAYADERWPWLADTRSLITFAHDRRIPVLGICLGAQLAAVAAGGKVEVGADKGSEYGVTALTKVTNEASEPARSLLSRLFSCTQEEHLNVFEDHSDAVSDAGAMDILAFSEKYPQIFQWGSVLGVQFHPEVTFELAHAWQENNDQTDTEKVMSDFVAHEEELHATCEVLYRYVCS